MALISLGSHTPHLGTLDGKFHFVLVSHQSDQSAAGLRVGQVHMIFRLPRQFGKDSRPLAYIELFTPLRAPDLSSQM
jgi:hypothetical protein